MTSKGEGQPGCRGPLLSRGYYDDETANAKLFTEDGWMLTGDVVTLDPEGVLSVVGRTADFIIRGGKNVSAAAVEDAARREVGDQVADLARKLEVSQQGLKRRMTELELR